MTSSKMFNTSPLTVSTLGEELRTRPPMNVVRRRERIARSPDGRGDIFLIQMYIRTLGLCGRPWGQPGSGVDDCESGLHLSRVVV